RRSSALGPGLLAAVAAVVEAPDEPFDDLLFFDFFLAMSYGSYLFGSHFEHGLSTLFRRLLRVVEPAHERLARRYLNSPSVDASCWPPPDRTPLASSLPSSTPLWPKPLTFHTTPCTKTLCP